MSFISSQSTLNIGDSNSTTVNITAATTLNLGKAGGSVNLITTQLPTTDSSTKIATTAWTQSLNVLNVQKTFTVKYESTGTIITIPAGVQYVDLVIISPGGQCGASNGSNYGGSGGGGTTCILTKMLVDENEKFNYEYASGYVRAYYTNPLSSTETYVELCYIPAGGAGVAATSGGGGGAVGLAPTLSDTYGPWKTLYGTTGVTSGNTTQPNTGGAPTGRPWVNGEPGCGKRIPSEYYGRPVLYITYYYL